jgi:hypothetical protein
MNQARGRRPVITLLFGLSIALSTAGCQPPAASGTPPAASPPTLAPGPTPEPTGPPSPETMELRAAPGRDLAPGRYTKSGFVPRITFEVSGPWRAVQVLPGFFDVQQDVGTPDVTAVQFARPDGIYTGPGTFVAPTTAQAAADAIQANPSLTVLGSSPSLFDGGSVSGIVVVIENPANAAGDVEVIHVPPGPLYISPSRRLWIAFLDRPEGLLAIMVGGSVAQWDESLLTAEPVLESVTIGR